MNPLRTRQNLLPTDEKVITVGQLWIL
jgi:hypothetical protein